MNWFAAKLKNGQFQESSLIRGEKIDLFENYIKNVVKKLDKVH